MSNHPDESSLLSPPKHAATDIHAESNRLTERLLRIEALLGELPWKLPISYWVEDCGTVDFVRHDNRWVLAWMDRGAGARQARLVKDCSLEIRAIVSRELPKLVSRMREEFDARAEVLKRGHSALDAFEAELDRIATNSGEDPQGREGSE